MPEQKKRETAIKLRVNDILKGTQIYEEIEGLTNKRLKFIEVGDKKVVRVNIIANVVDKYESEGERRFGSITIDDGTGQIRAGVFAEDMNKFDNISQGDTVIIIGVLRSYNEELYVLPELVKKQDPKYLLIRKLEIEKSYPKMPTSIEKKEIRQLRDEIISLIKDSESKEGIDKEELIMKIKSPPELISQEIKKILEEGIAYEPKPGRVRYLG